MHLLIYTVKNLLILHLLRDWHYRTHGDTRENTENVVFCPLGPEGPLGADRQEAD